jgi:hypothetical protein
MLQTPGARSSTASINTTTPNNNVESDSQASHRRLRSCSRRLGHARHLAEERPVKFQRGAVSGGGRDDAAGEEHGARVLPASNVY